MIELALPLVGTLIVFGLIVPLVTLAAKGLLWPLGRFGPMSALRSSSLVYLLIAAPGLAPAIWFASAAVHQSEPGQGMIACLVPHGTEACLDLVLFAVLLLMPAAYKAARRDGLGRRPALPMSPRLEAVCAGHPRLRAIRSAIVVVRGPGPAICSTGLLARRIEIDEAFLAQLDDAALEAALLHEEEHHQSWDALRYAVASLSLSLNPARRWLAAEHAAFRLSREVRCDARAVEAGADPVALAAAILAAARPLPSAGGPCLEGDGVGTLELRIYLLLNRGRARALDVRSPAGLLPALLVAWLAVPHALGAAPLDWLHRGVETAMIQLSP